MTAEPTQYRNVEPHQDNEGPAPETSPVRWPDDGTKKDRTGDEYDDDDECQGGDVGSGSLGRQVGQDAGDVPEPVCPVERGCCRNSQTLNVLRFGTPLSR
jgi:hypothetical protein